MDFVSAKQRLTERVEQQHRISALGLAVARMWPKQDNGRSVAGEPSLFCPLFPPPAGSLEPDPAARGTARFFMQVW